MVYVVDDLGVARLGVGCELGLDLVGCGGFEVRAAGKMPRVRDGGPDGLAKGCMDVWARVVAVAAETI